MDSVEKQRLRREARQAVAKVAVPERRMQGLAICRRLEEWPVWQRAERVGGFLAIAGEPILDLAWLLQKPLLIPRVQGEHLRFLRVCSAKDLETGEFGLLEPHGDLVEEKPDLVLVPGLAFDEHGGRLGRGRGYYDRFLDRHSAVRVGVGLDEAVVKRVPMESHDAKIDYLVTSGRMVNCSA